MSHSEGDLATVAGVGSESNGRSGTRPRTRALERGDVVGRYVVLERLGVGGMGEVYAAYDPELDRKVAIKLLLAEQRSEADSSIGHGRLLREAQAMAKLRHANVVAVHDVGTLDQRVFVAMEFVDGGNLADWMSEGSDGNGRPHPWPEVLARFLAAGEGLAAAHAAGLIHRDFKPANVLVGRDGSIRVADFGLARSTDADANPGDAASPVVAMPELAAVAIDSATLPALEHSFGGGKSIKSLSMRMTMTGATLGTPAYMAPEQYSHTEVDARADQFGFCVALWEALYGERPFAGDNLHVLMFAIHQGKLREPPPNSDVPATIRRALVRGLAHDRRERWPDMPTLLAALRFDPRQRRRNVQLSVLGVALLGALSWGVVATRPQVSEPEPVCTGAAAALGDALSPARRDAIAARFAALEHDWAHDLAERLPKRLEQWTRDWEAAWTEACEATHVRAEQSSELLDRRLSCLDRQRRGFVKLVDALAQADDALARRADAALAELGSLAACSDSDSLLRITKMPDDPERAGAIITAEQVLADVHGMFIAGQMHEAKALLESQTQIVTELDFAPLSAQYEQLLGRIAMDLEDVAGGEAALERSFANALEAGDDRRAAQIARSLAYELEKLDRLNDASRWLSIAAALAERLDDDILRGQIEITNTQVLAALGDYPASAASAQRAYTTLKDAGADNELLGDALYLIALADFRASRYDQTIARIEEARAVWTEEIGPRHPRNVAALGLLGGTHRIKGEYAAAERYFREALAIEIDTYGPEHIQATTHMINLGIVLADQNRYDEAIELTERVLAIRQGTPDSSPTWTARTIVNLASMQQRTGRPEQALTRIREAEAILGEALGPDHPDMMVLYSIRADIEFALGDYAAAERSSTHALQIAEAKYGAENSGMFELWTQAGKIALARGEPKRAAALLKGVANDDMAAKTIGEREFVHAQILAALGDRDGASEAAKRAIAAFERDGPGSAQAGEDAAAWLRAHESR